VLIPYIVGGQIVEVPTISQRPKAYWSATDYRVQIAQQAGRFTGSLWICEVADSVYYLAPKADLEKLVKATRVDQLKFLDEVSDCDDFALKEATRVMAAAFADDAYREIEGKRIRRPPYLFGQCDSYDHAFNFCFADDGLLYFVEPQTAQFIPVERFEYGVVVTRV
jgi:hypothetical protein